MCSSDQADTFLKSPFWERNGARQVKKEPPRQKTRSSPPPRSTAHPRAHFTLGTPEENFSSIGMSNSVPEKEATTGADTNRKITCEGRVTHMGQVVPSPISWPRYGGHRHAVEIMTHYDPQKPCIPLCTHHIWFTTVFPFPH